MRLSVNDPDLEPAGAKTLVLSLWRIPDSHIWELMSSFYEHLLMGLPQAQALREVQLEMKAK